MRSKWITFVVASMLGIFGQLGFVVSEDASSDSASSEPVVDIALQKKAHDLLRQSISELEAHHFDAARRLAKQAKDLGATFSLFDIRPEHVLAEIDRQERNGTAAGKVATVEAPSTKADDKKTAPSAFNWAQKQEAVVQTSAEGKSAKPTVNASRDVVSADSTVTTAEKPSEKTRDQKAQAVELLDQGLLALDEKRFQDAERLARKAAKLQVTWDKYDYRPENLLDEARLQSAADVDRKSVASSKPTSEAIAAEKTSPKWDDLPETPVAKPTSSPSLATNEPSSALAKDREAIAQTIPQGSAQTTEPSMALEQQRSEALLKQALGDLRAGRDESARNKIEGALLLIHAPDSPAATPKPLNKTTKASMTASNSNSPVFRPFAQEDGRAAASANVGASVEMLKPIHDRFMGDEPLQTQSSSPTEKRFLEKPTPSETVNALYQPKRPAPAMSDEVVRQTSYESLASQSAHSNAASAQSLSSPNAPANLTRPSWLDKMSEPVGPPNLLSPPTRKPATAPRTVASAATPSSSSLPSNGQWTSAARQPYPPPRTVSSEGAAQQEQQRPGYFRKLWNAIKGE